MQANPNGAVSAPATITIPQREAWTAIEAITRDLERLLTDTAEKVSEFHTRRDGMTFPMPLAADVRPMFEWINEQVEALDALGWRAAVEANEAKLDVEAGLTPEGDR